MSNRPSPPPTSYRPPHDAADASPASADALPRWRRWLAHPLANLVPLALIVLVAWAAYALYYSDRVYPGVRVLGVDVGGLTREQVEARLADRLPILKGDVVLKDPVDRRAWTKPARVLGLGDAVDLSEAAFAVGREADTLPQGFLPRLIFHPWLWRHGYVVPIERLFDVEQAKAGLEEITASVDVPPANASLTEEDGQLVAKPSSPGRQLDVNGTLQVLARALEVKPDESPLGIDIAITRTGARLADLSSVADAYNTVTGSDLTMVMPGGNKLLIPASVLRSWTKVENLKNLQGDIVPTIVIDRDAIRLWLAQEQLRLRQEAEEARFVLTSDGIRLQRGSASGLTLDVESSVNRIVEAAYQPQHLGELAARIEAVSSSDGTDVDVWTKLHDQTDMEERVRAASVLGGPGERLQNLAVASERFNGIAVAPGAEFSFNHYLGTVSAAGGYRLALFGLNATDLISPGQAVMPLNDPSGVLDQLASMAFRLAFWSGLPITERHAPATRHGWLEPPVGLDASVNGLDRDLKFKNDTTGYLLIFTTLEADRDAITWSLWGPRQTRRVKVPQLTVTDITPSATQRIISTDLLSRTVRLQVGAAREGASASVVRLVQDMATGETVLGDTFDSRYGAAGDVVITASGP